MKLLTKYLLAMSFSLLILGGCGLGVSSGILKSKAYGVAFKASGNAGGTLDVLTPYEGCKSINTMAVCFSPKIQLV